MDAKEREAELRMFAGVLLIGYPRRDKNNALHAWKEAEDYQAILDATAPKPATEPAKVERVRRRVYKNKTCSYVYINGEFYFINGRTWEPSGDFMNCRIEQFLNNEKSSMLSLEESDKFLEENPLPPSLLRSEKP